MLQVIRKMWPLALVLTLIAGQVFEASAFQTKTAPLPPDPKPQPADLTAEQLIAKANAARGGEAKLKGIKSVTMTGTLQTNRIKLSPVTLTIAPGLYLRRTEAVDAVMIKAVDGTTSWEVTPITGVVKPTPMPAKEGDRYRRLADPQGPLVDAKAKGNKVEVLGIIPWKDSKVYKTKVIFSDGGVNYYYLDTKSFLPVRIVNTMYVPQLDREVVIEFLYEDFRDVGGVKWPFVEKANSPEVHFTQDINWKKIEPNKAFDRAAFKMPKS